MYFTEGNTPIINTKRFALDTVIERYVGRRPELIKAEQAMEKLIDKIKKGSYSILKGTSGDISQKEINDSPENKEIQAQFKKLFKVKNFDLLWMYTAFPNACTPCKSLQLLNKDYNIDKDGVDYNEKLDMMVVTHTGLATHLNLTAPEIIAIILHEIGHNFYQSAFQLLTSFNPFSPVFTTYMTVLNEFLDIGKGLLRFEDFVNRSIDFLKLRKINNTVEELKMVIGMFSPQTMLVLIGLLKGRLYIKDETIIYNLVQPSTIFLYSVEKHADSFAVDYGYGVHLASGLNKLDMRDNNVVYNIPGYNWIRDLEALFVDITFQTFSGYPTMHNRQQSALKRLKDAKNDPDLPPHLRKELDSQIKEFEAYYKNYMSFENKENKRRIFSWSYRMIIDKAFKGNVDLREIFHKMDSEYNKKWGDLKN